MENKEYENTQYSSEGTHYESDQYLEKCIKGRNKEIAKLYEKIELLKSYNRRDRVTIEENQRQEMEYLKSKLLNDLDISEDEDLRDVYIIFNNKLEYVNTIRLNAFSNFIKDKEEYKNFHITRHALEHYLRAQHLYANSAKYFVDKPLKWYKKSFKSMLLSFGGWKIDENGLLTDVEW